MKAIWIIARREFVSYFITPIAYIYLIAFAAVSYWFFFRGFFLMGQADLRAFFGMMPWVFLFFVPAVAMGKWAEEKRNGTIEILFTLPVARIDIVIAKFLAGWGLVMVALLLTLPMAITAHLVGNLDWGPLLCGS